MAKEVENYNDIEHENDSHKMMAHINSKSAEIKAVEEDRSRQQNEEREKIRLTKVGKYTLRCLATLLVTFGLYKAMNAVLIAPVIVIPATYVCAIYFGWCSSKVAHYVKKGRVSK